MFRLIRLMTMAAALALPASAQDITGDWQGRLTLGGEELRVTLQVTKDPAVGWKATAVVVTPGGIPGRLRVSPVTLAGSTLMFAIEEVSGAYEGTDQRPALSSGSPQRLQLRPSWGHPTYLEPRPPGQSTRHHGADSTPSLSHSTVLPVWSRSAPCPARRR